jgi:hypothetical protein
VRAFYHDVELGMKVIPLAKAACMPPWLMPLRNRRLCRILR